VSARGVGARAFTRRTEQRATRERTRWQRRHTGPPRSNPLAPLRQIPTAAWACMLVAFLSAACWSFITPPFQVPDEPAHFAYVQQLAETGELSTSGNERYSPEEMAALQGLRQEEVKQSPQILSISSLAEQRSLQSALGAPLSRTDGGNAGVAATEPPLYYALETIPYSLGSAGTLLDSLELMRLLSALMAGLTALFTFMFVREALPRVPWAWSVAGLAVAIAPLLGFMSGAVNPDSMLYAVSAALFYCLARAFRRGLTRRSACAIGAVIAIGLLTKVNFIGLLPGAILGLVLLARAAARTSGRDAYRWLALALAIVAAPTILYGLLSALADHPTLGLVSSAVGEATHHGSLLGEISYIWQLYLPRLPGMAHDFPGYSTARGVWFDGYVGLYGWLETTFPGWVYDAALLPAVAILALCGRSLLTSRAALRGRLGELLVYGTIGAGVMALVGADSYLDFPEIAAEYGQTRYLLPMLPLLGVVLALAARGAGRRWGPVAGALIVALFLAHDLFSQLQVIARYYG
jgi:4-amino-4-deoxy-L-arabinose transferase-like glycosyltransferase